MRNSPKGYYRHLLREATPWLQGGGLFSDQVVVWDYQRWGGEL